MIGLVVALESELKNFYKVIDDKKEKIIASKKIVTGKISGKDIALIVSSVGKVNAAISTQILIDKFSPSVIINFGSAGSVSEKAKILNYYVAESCIQFDFDTREIDNYPLGYIQDYKMNFFPSYTDSISLETCILATADRFNSGKKDFNVLKKLNVEVKDMEGAAISHTCYANGVKSIIIKGITDTYGSGASFEQFYGNLEKVCNGFNTVIPKIIKEINFN